MEIDVFDMAEDLKDAKEQIASLWSAIDKLQDQDQLFVQARLRLT